MILFFAGKTRSKDLSAVDEKQMCFIIGRDRNECGVSFFLEKEKIGPFL